MSAADHSTPAGRRCPECEGASLTDPLWDCKYCENGRFFSVPTPAPEGGNNTTLGDTIARESMPTPTSAEGGEAIVVNLNPPRWTTCANCEADTPCEQGLPKNDGGEFVDNDYEGEWVGVPACRRCYEAHASGGVAALDAIRKGQSPTPAATGGEDSDSIRRAILYDPRLYAAYTIGRQREAAEADSLRRQLAEAEATTQARAVARLALEAEYEAEVAALTERATTAERRLEDMKGEHDFQRDLRKHTEDQLTASQQEVARLREALEAVEALRSVCERIIALWHTDSGDRDFMGALSYEIPQLRAAIDALSSSHQSTGQGGGV